MRKTDVLLFKYSFNVRPNEPKFFMLWITASLSPQLSYQRQTEWLRVFEFSSYKWRFTDQPVDNWGLVWDYGLDILQLLLVSNKETNRVYIFWKPVRFGKRSVEVVGKTALGKCTGSLKQQHVPVCVTLDLTLPGCRSNVLQRRRRLSAEIQAQSFDVLPWW